MSTTVQRLPADRPGDAIVSSVLTSVESQLERGRYEVNTEDRDRLILEVEILEPDFIQPGSLRSVNNQGDAKNGLHTRFSYDYSTSATNVSVATDITLEAIA